MKASGSDLLRPSAIFRGWRIGTMGYSAQHQNVLLCLAAMEVVRRADFSRIVMGRR